MTISILVYILAAIVALAIIWIWVLQRRMKRFFTGTNSQDLEESMTQIMKQLKDVKEAQMQINKHLVVVDNRLNKSIRNVQTIRFNPFEDAGSNQSFALSFLNDEGDGVVISSLYARDRMSIFAKPIKKGGSEFELSVEEKDVVKKSLRGASSDESE